MANIQSEKQQSSDSKNTNIDLSNITSSDSKTSNANDSSKNTDDNKDDKQDKLKRFENEGVIFKAKLIGSELVMDPRGDKMCQASIQRLKAIIKGTNSHKRRIVLKISYDGIKVFDEKTNEMLHHHEVPQVSYIASDDTDTRTFGYVCDLPNKAHQFICFKTSGPAMNVMSVISALFEAVLDKKKKSGEENDTTKGKEKSVKPMESIDLVGDSGIMDADLSFSSDINKQHQTLNQSSSVLADSILSYGAGDSFSNAAWSGHDQAMTRNIENQQQQQQQPQATQRQLQKQPSSADLLFADLFACLSDPIIVDKNDSLVSSKFPLESSGSSSQNMGSSNRMMSQGFEPPPASQQMYHHSMASTIRARPSASFQASAHPIPARQSSVSGSSGMSPFSLPRQAPMMPEPPRHNRSLVYNHSSMSLSDAALTRQFSFNSPPNQNDGYVDRYSVFNNIDNMPSIFESTSLGNNSNNNNNNMNSANFGSNNQNGKQANLRAINIVNDTFNQRPGQFGSRNVETLTSSHSFGSNLVGTGGNPMMSSGAGGNISAGQANQNPMFRQRNPFDDDFFS